MEDHQYLTKDMEKQSVLRAIQALNGKWQMLTLLGWSVDDIASRPIIGIVSSYSEICPGHAHLREVSEAVKKGIIQAGGIPAEFGTIGVCDVSQNGYVLPTREVICDSIELMAGAHEFDGLVLLGSCDKIVPGMLMAAVRCDLPTIMVTGGPALGGPAWQDRPKVENTAKYEAWGMYQAGKISAEEVLRVTKTVMPTIGSCSYYGTANTMSCIAEVLGLELPDGGATPAVFADRLKIAKASGTEIVRMVRKKVTAKSIITQRSIQNAIAFLMATGGSTNAVLHLTAIAYEIGIEPEWMMAEFDRQSRKVPQIACIFPSGTDQYLMEDFHAAGGVPRVMENLGTYVDLNCMTVTGKSWRENLRQHIYWQGPVNTNVIRTLDDPFGSDSLAILYGNLATGSAVCKPAGISKHMRTFTGKAVCFDCEEDASAALARREIVPGQVVVIRYSGPKGEPGMREMSVFIHQMSGQGLEDSTALITDGRFSGTDHGCFVGHISPEAAEGGTIALVEDGDEITVDIETRRLTLHVSLEELEERRKHWHYEPKIVKGYMSRYLRLAESAGRGAVLT